MLVVVDFFRFTSIYGSMQLLIANYGSDHYYLLFMVVDVLPTVR